MKLLNTSLDLALVFYARMDYSLNVVLVHQTVQQRSHLEVYIIGVHFLHSRPGLAVVAGQFGYQVEVLVVVVHPVLLL